eukprot:PhF_6_TR8923/c0_g1_i1/m.14081
MPGRGGKTHKTRNKTKKRVRTRLEKRVLESNKSSADLRQQILSSVVPPLPPILPPGAYKKPSIVSKKLVPIAVKVVAPVQVVGQASPKKEQSPGAKKEKTRKSK